MADRYWHIRIEEYEGDFFINIGASGPIGAPMNQQDALTVRRWLSGGNAYGTKTIERLAEVLKRELEFNPDK